MRFRNRPVSILAILLSLAASAFAATPGLVSYQGKLADGAGVALNGNFSLTFNIYGSAGGGIPLWTETQNPVVVDEGLFNVLLGSVSPLNEALFSGANRYIGVQVNGGAELAPRRQFVTVAYAFTAVEADSTTWSGIKGIPAGFADGVDDVGAGGGGDITAVNTSGGLTGGVTTGDANISIASGGVTSTHIGDGQILNADISAAANIAAAKINGTAATLGGINLFAAANQFNSTLEVCDSTIRIDCNGISIGRNVTPSALYLVQSRRNYSSNSARYGVYTALHNDGAGSVYGSYSSAVASTLGDPGSGTVYGSYSLGESDNALRYGSYSVCSARNAALNTGVSYGHYASAYDGEDAYGVYGRATSARFGYGVYGESTGNSTYNIGVKGEGYGEFESYGVIGDSHDAKYGHGVYGRASGNSTSGIGVYGIAVGNPGTGYGIYCTASVNTVEDWAGYFFGNVNVTGTIFMPAKMTRIDHPLDPENKYLVHNTVESSEMTNLYSGNAVLDANGEAVVMLPDWFEAANKNFRYQLTCIGGYAPVYVAEKITSNQFKIAGGSNGLEVSWQIMAVRDDQYAKANPMSSVTEKRPHERGKYRFPEVFGLGKDRAVDTTDPLADMEARKAELEQLSKNKPTRPTEHESHEE